MIALIFEVCLLIGLHEASDKVHLTQASKRGSFKHGSCVAVHGLQDSHSQLQSKKVE